MLKLRLLTVLSAVLLISLLSSCSDNSTNTNPGLIIHDKNITADETWCKDNLHRVEGVIVVKNAIITICAGTTVEFAEDARIIFEDNGGIVADGTQDTIYFTGTSKIAGWWHGFEFRDDANHSSCVFNHCVFEYGTSTLHGALIEGLGANFTINNSLIRRSAKLGIYLNANARPKINNTQITENGTMPVSCFFQNLPSFMGGTYTGNTNDYFEVDNGTITENAIIEKHDVPYRMTDDVNAVNNATLTIKPGVRFEFDALGRFLVEKGGGIITDGTGDPIVFTSVTKAKGSWRYIEIRDDANDAACIFDNCIVEYSGQNKGAFFLTSECNPTIKNTTISNSASCGIFTGNNAMPIMSNNTFMNNDGDDICDK